MPEHFLQNAFYLTDMKYLLMILMSVGKTYISILLIHSDATSLLDSTLTITLFTVIQTVSRYIHIPLKHLLKSTPFA